MSDYDDLNLVTCSYKALRSAPTTDTSPVPVRISVGAPKFWPGSESFPTVKALCPYGLLGIADDDLFVSAYCERLDKYGVESIAEALRGIQDAYPNRPLALLCFEDLDHDWCHRRVFADWWQRNTGKEIPEYYPDGKQEAIAF